MLTAGPALATATGHVSVAQEQFFSPDFEASQQKGFSYLGAKVRSQLDPQDESKTGLIADVDGQFSPGVSVMSYLNISEFAFRTQQFAVGRLKKNWSRTDEIWKLGLFQPQFRFNPLDPKTQGLTGLFLELEGDGMGFRIFGSAIFIPDQGAGYEIKKGKFESTNPWFEAPPEKIQFFGVTDRLEYQVQNPDMAKIVFNPSYVAQVYFGDRDKGFYAESSFASKPSHQLALGFDGFGTPNQVVQVNVLPQFYRHSLIAAELSYSQNGVAGGVAGLSERPEVPDFAKNYTYVIYEPSTVVSPFVRFQSTRWMGLLSYMKVSGGAAHLEGDLASTASQSSFMPPRYPYSEAARADLQYTTKFRQKRALSLKATHLRSPSNLFAMWGGGGEWVFDRFFSVSAEFLLATAADSEEARSTVVGRYANNDTARLGLSYAF